MLSSVGVAAAVTLGLYASSLYSYILFHSLIEIVTIAVAFTVFILSWHTRRYFENDYLRLLGIGYGFIALIDLLHTLAYKGMGVFPGYDANLPTQLWIAARYLQAVTLFAAPYFVERGVSDRAIFGGYAAATAVLVVTVYTGSFPDCYIEGAGLTLFKVSSEYVISAVLLVSLYLFYRKRKYFNGRIFFLIAASIFCTVISEMAFTAYLSVYGFANLAGHFAKLAAFYLIYRAILVTGLQEPFDLIFRDLKQAEEALQKSLDATEEEVRTRTAELRQLNQELEARIAAEVARSREKDHILIQQSRLAAMGEMVHNIAHQWRQPLNALAIVIGNIHADFRDGVVTNETLDKAVATARRLIDGMTTTIDEFRDFFRPDSEEVHFEVAGAVRDAISLVDAAMKHNRIGLEYDLEEGLLVSGHPNQYAQAVLNVLVNAKEAMVGRQVQDGRIRLKLTSTGGDAELTIDDEGGGIPEDILPKIFDPYFTTKEQGSGIGLYMAKMIIEKAMGGHVETMNAGNGARLIFRIPLLDQQERKPALLEPAQAMDQGIAGGTLGKDE